MYYNCIKDILKILKIKTFWHAMFVEEKIKKQTNKQTRI
jgi:hypothetical protein